MQYPLYTVMVFDAWRNGIPVAFFLVSRCREDDLRPLLDALHCNVQILHKTWSPSSIIVDNAQAEINTLRYIPLCYAFYDMRTSCHAFIDGALYVLHIDMY